jgi:hypothetical protein
MRVKFTGGDFSAGRWGVTWLPTDNLKQTGKTRLERPVFVTMEIGRHRNYPSNVIEVQMTVVRFNESTGKPKEDQFYQPVSIDSEKVTHISAFEGDGPACEVHFIGGAKFTVRGTLAQVTGRIFPDNRSTQFRTDSSELDSADSLS